MQVQVPLIPFCPPQPLPVVPCNNFLQQILPIQVPFFQRINTTDDQPPDGCTFERLLGQGAFGKVYLTRHWSSPQFFAVKYATQTYWNPQSQVNVKALTEEYNILSQMSHKNIVSCLGLSTNFDNSKWYLFLEYMDLGSIKSLYAPNRPLHESYVQYITKEVLEGLFFLHWNGIVHRDIKGDNILINSFGMIKIGDFGITKFIYPVPPEGFGLQTKMIGTLTHMAPEIRFTNCPKSYDGRVDIWSLGCTVLEMLTGNSPRIDFNFDNMSTDCRCTYYPPQNITNNCIQFIQCTLSANPANRPHANILLGYPWMRF